MKNLIVLFLFFWVILGCGQAPKDNLTIFHNGQILTINATNEQVAAMAIKGDKIIGLGAYDDLMQQFQANYTIETIDLNGNTLMPGIHENHSHPIWGAMKDVFELNFPWYEEPEKLKASINQYIKDNQPSLILGGAWGSQYFEVNKMESPLKWLDSINSEIPIVLFDDASHNLWVNSAGLKLGSITKDTPDPQNGRIEKDASGHPNGILYENATFLVRDQITHTAEKYRAAIDYAQKQALSFGIIGIKDAAADAKSIEVFSKMDKEGAIDMFFGLCQATPFMVRDTLLEVNNFVTTAEKYKTDNIDPYYIKFFLDGIPTSSRTAAMLCTYNVDEKHSEHTHGMIHVAPDILAKDIANLDKLGFTIKVHAAGDSSARAAINAIEFARTTNGNKDHIHELAHASYIDDKDLPRMKNLNIGADFSPYLWFPSPIIDNILSTVCEEKSQQFWEIKKIYAQDIHCTAGSDWPAVAMNLNPWIGIEAMVTRKNPIADSPETFLLQQAIPLVDALKIFTINGAKALNRADVSGSLETGKYADFIILDQPILTVEPEKISDTKVLATYYKGMLKYEHASSN